MIDLRFNVIATIFNYIIHSFVFLKGPKLNALDVVTDNANTFMLAGSETNGALYLYSINTTAGYPVPKFESAHRAGLVDYVWSELYDMNEAGDAGISAIG
jgi:hypothetical protein